MASLRFCWDSCCFGLRGQFSVLWNLLLRFFFGKVPFLLRNFDCAAHATASSLAQLMYAHDYGWCASPSVFSLGMHWLMGVVFYLWNTIGREMLLSYSVMSSLHVCLTAALTWISAMLENIICNVVSRLVLVLRFLLLRSCRSLRLLIMSRWAMPLLSMRMCVSVLCLCSLLCVQRKVETPTKPHHKLSCLPAHGTYADVTDVAGQPPCLCVSAWRPTNQACTHTGASYSSCCAGYTTTGRRCRNSKYSGYARCCCCEANASSGVAVWGSASNSSGASAHDSSSGRRAAKYYSCLSNRCWDRAKSSCCEAHAASDIPASSGYHSCLASGSVASADNASIECMSASRPVGMPIRVRFQVDIEPVEPAQPAPPEDPAAQPQQPPPEQQPAQRDAEGHS